MKKFLPSFLLCYTGLLQAQPIQPSIAASVTMRDGKEIAADVYLPGNGTYPVILIQTPYNKNLYRLAGLPLGIRNQIGQSPYAVVIADWRCFYSSTAACVAQPDRGKDGYDLIEWISSQPWSNGRIGTWGPSALGRIQYLTAREQHPNHICAVPLVAGPQYSYQEYFPGGCLRTEYVEQLDALGFGLSTLLYANPVYNLIWQIAEDNSDYPDEIEIPVLNIGGWFDHNTDVQIEIFNQLRQESAPGIRSQHRLLMGPWAHGGFNGNGPGSINTGQLHFPLAQSWSDSIARTFLDFHLRELPNGWEQSPYIQFYRPGDEQWESAAVIPFPGANDRTLHLSAANELLPQQESGNASLSYLYDPRDPSPTIGGTTLRTGLDQGPYDQALLVESREDIQVFTSEVLSAPVKLAGKARAVIWFSSDRTDTDLCIRLTDVYPDGRSILLADGVRRLRFRSSYSSPRLMEPGTVYEVEVELPFMVNTFLPGHRIRLSVSSSNYPRFDLNLNNGGALYNAGDTLTATQTLHFSSQHPSRIVLPVQSDFTVGMPPEQGTPELHIFPNPASLGFTVTEIPAGINKIQLSDITGKMLRDIPCTTPSILIHTTGLAPGIYQVKALGTYGEITRKVVIQ